MSDIHTVPASVTDAGLQFSYSLWTAGTQVTLANVDWNATYKDVVDFATEADAIKHVKSRSRNMVPVTTSYIKVNEPIRLNIPFNIANTYNYIMVQNPAQPIAGDVPRTFFYFINDVAYLAPNTTVFNVQLDVWTTFSRDVTLRQMFVERGHVGVHALEKAWSKGERHEALRKYAYEAEGFDIGAEYVVEKTSRVNIGRGQDGCGAIIVCTTELSTADYGSVSNPKLETSWGSFTRGIPNGAGIYYIDSLDGLSKIFERLSSYPWVAQGIISVMIIPRLREVKGKAIDTGPLSGEGLIRLNAYQHSWTIKVLNNIWETDGNQSYSDFKKFYSSPFRMIELTTFNPQSLMLKPELISSKDGSLEVGVSAHVVPPNPRLMYYARRYSGAITSGEYGVDSENFEWFGHAAGVTDLPMVSTVNNSYLAYMASNAHTIAFQYQNAEWSQTRVLAGANLAFNQSSAAMGLTSDLASNQIAANRASTDNTNKAVTERALLSGINSTVGGIMQGVGGNVAGGAAQASMGLFNAAIEQSIATSLNNSQNAVAANLTRKNTAASVGNMAYNRDTNFEYANFAAQGDYANEIAGIKAKIQDAQLMSPTTVGRTGGDAFMLAENNMTFFLWARVKVVNPQIRDAISEFWNRYGYAVNRFVNLRNRRLSDPMKVSTYWKAKEVYITSTRCPEVYRKTIAGILEKGVTVWRDPTRIGSFHRNANQPDFTKEIFDYVI